MWQRRGAALVSICALSVGLLLAAAPAETASRFASARYAVDGGSARERAQIEAALAASAFDWRLVPVPVQVHIRPGVAARATPGHVWLSTELLASGRFAWAVIQDEFAHQIDFFLLDESKRALLNAALGGESWYAAPGVPHERRGAERFAATLVWTYWPSRENSYRPRSPRDESAALEPERFRRLLALLLATE
jgi:hypothetical protein